MELIKVNRPDQLANLQAESKLPSFDPEDLIRHAPDAHWVLLDADKRIEAQCSLWWNHAPPYLSHRLGLVGHYAAVDMQAGRRVLRHACEELAAKGCSLAVGPMDGNTWRHYRLITERGSEPTFFLELDNPDDWPEHFLEEGFTSLANYTSALNSDLSRQHPRIQEVARRLSENGIRIRSACSDLEQELPCIFSVSKISFQKNLLYTPIEDQEFVSQYRTILPYVRPELVLLAEQQDRTIGFLFALPDMLRAQRGRPIDTIIIKTVAVLPESSAVGLGSLLVARAQEIARELGYTRAIHALMHESNVSRNISGQYASTMRRYTLFSRSLAS